MFLIPNGSSKPRPVEELLQDLRGSPENGGETALTPSEIFLSMWEKFLTDEIKDDDLKGGINWLLALRNKKPLTAAELKELRKVTLHYLTQHWFSNN